MNGHQPIGGRVRQRLEQKSIDGREDRRIRADAQRQRRDDGERHRRAAPEPANGEGELTEHVVRRLSQPGWRRWQKAEGSKAEGSKAEGGKAECGKARQQQASSFSLDRPAFRPSSLRPPPSCLPRLPAWLALESIVPSNLRRQIGQLLIAGFNGHQIPPELRSLAKEFGLGGVILFARNVAEPEQVAELSFDAARLVPELPLWV